MLQLRHLPFIRYPVNVSDTVTTMLSELAVPAVATRVSDALRAIGLELRRSTIASAAILLVVTIGMSLEEITALRVRSTAEVCKLLTLNVFNSASNPVGQVYTVAEEPRSCPTVLNRDTDI